MQEQKTLCLQRGIHYPFVRRRSQEKECLLRSNIL
jgi:hypothetical protein